MMLHYDYDMEPEIYTAHIDKCMYSSECCIGVKTISTISWFVKTSC